MSTAYWGSEVAAGVRVLVTAHQACPCPAARPARPTP
jgi:hypothetical protein